ncbi:hypothetical protein RJ639_042326 [Escallonia herrerae]|uniref:Uncharacterized protein n=1 Tax=Escallonia herrerae TaxID=1293975 RepID=A0AA89B7N0_9ASTE|nr:hypothetical protein RJ639_016055 [Escallonia herrerae]KAK3027557.1 hypothetical protein RJ639_042326 [Escallonia herrerae]
MTEKLAITLKKEPPLLLIPKFAKLVSDQQCKGMWQAVLGCCFLCGKNAAAPLIQEDLFQEP